MNDALHALRSLTVRRSFCRDPFRENLPFAVAISAAPGRRAVLFLLKLPVDGGGWSSTQRGRGKAMTTREARNCMKKLIDVAY
jgi:hypothetical protein